jgi:hypothetical protein
MSNFQGADGLLSMPSYVNLCSCLDSLEYDESALCSADLLSGGYKFSDEIPMVFEMDQSHAQDVISLLRYLWAYRASIVINNPLSSLADCWNRTKQYAPNWPGFYDERCSSCMMSFVIHECGAKSSKDFIESIEKMGLD